EAVDLMAEDDVIAVVGERGTSVDVGDGAVGGGQDGIGGLAFFVALQTANIEAFVKLPAFGANATEGAAGPGFAGGGDEEFFFLAGFVEGVVGGREEEGLGGTGGQGEEECGGEEKMTNDE